MNDQHHRRVVRRPRGRPQRLPSDETPVATDQVDGAKRLSWLLATRRIMSPTVSTTRSQFAAHLRDREVRADPSRISRWESGLEAVPVRVVQAYEPATGALPGSLSAARLMLVRGGHLDDRLATRAHEPEPDDCLLDEVMEYVLAGTATGQQWLQFASELRRYDKVYLAPSTWQESTDRLIGELGRSAGLASLLRFEAAALMMGHATARAHLSRSVGQFALAPGSAPMAPRVLSVLGQAPDGASAELLLRMVSTSPPELSGAAAQVAASLIDQGHVAADSPVLEFYVGRTLARSGPGVLPRTALVDLASRLADPAFLRVLSTLEDVRTRRWLQQARTTQLLVDGDEARILTDHVAGHAEDAAGRAGQDPDQMLRRLVLETLFHVRTDRRDQAATLLLASPYAPHVGDVVLRLCGHRDDLIARVAWAAAWRLGAALDIEAVADQARGEVRPEMVPVALSTTWQSADALPPAFADHVATMVAAPATDPAHALAGVVSLGLNAQADHLRGLQRPDIAETTRWLLEAGSAIHH
ncbi:hypothetical protein ACFQ0K_04785 [Nocardioides caeni]|uniref:Uncharacterized protein n=1 Tax=Nocardioides caeni TaxID=574700 RepID=A0A4S8N7E0_9ACTN|nr:hypothetical protein [Nocardioides caeni]THV10819.1 hypothetical protein E9934_13910 [Nocardioides caeni]